jgi:uncharacterized membrane protein YphA (DoxX/SURF4 family)
MNKIYILIFSSIGLLTANTTFAHVKYVVGENEVKENLGADWEFLLSPLSDPINILLMVGTLIFAAFAVLIFTKTNFLKKEIQELKKRADSYISFAPWMLRLSLGIALIGSGVSNTLISPVLSGYDSFSFIQILIGFFIIGGFLVIPSALIAVFLYIIALTTDLYMIGNLDFLAIAIALLILDNERPGIDDLLNFPKVSPFRFLKKYVPLVLRIGIGGAMIYLALYEKLLNPRISEIVAVQEKLVDVIPVSAAMWVLSAGIIEFVIGLALILGLYTRISAGIAFIVLSLSFFYFNEDVYSHITLFGILSVLFISRGGKFSLDKKLGNVNRDFE